MSEHPLIAGFAPEAPFGAWRGRTLSAGAFVAAAHAVAARLPASGCVLLLCTDRLAFATGFAATLLRGLTALLPPSRAPLAMQRIVQSRAPACALVDVAGETGLVPEVVVDPWATTARVTGVPAIDGSHVAVIVHTSGTTGDPQPHVKTWSSLVRGAVRLRDRVGFAPGSALVGAVPAQHMWGLEATIMLALQGGGVVHAGSPLLPADIAAALQEVEAPRWLVITPLHIRNCLRAGAQLSPLAGALTATSALEPAVAAQFESLTGAPVVEIYGSTETGGIATRRPTRDTAFEPFDGVRVRQHGNGIEARGGHLDADVVIGDRVDVRTDGRFTLIGRDADLVKIGGKRASLAMLNAALLGVEGVDDGAFVVIDDPVADQRVAALAVAPSCSVAAVQRALRERLDPVFLPRPLQLVDALPRNALGKLPMATLREMLTMRSATPDAREPMRSHVAEAVVPATHPALPGHFPGRPIVPAAWILTLVASACREAWGEAAVPLRLQRARFRAPLRPQAQVRIAVERGDDGSISFACTQDATRIADGSFAAPGMPT